MDSCAPNDRLRKPGDGLHYGHIEINGERLPFCLRRGPRRKQARLLVTAEGSVEVRAPSSFSARRALGFIQANAVWVVETLRRVREREVCRPVLQTGTELPCLGETLRLSVQPATRESVRLEGLQLRVRGPRLDEPWLRVLVEQWYRAQALAHLPRRLRHWGQRLGLEPGKVTVRGQRTRWGSCSARGAISLNWHLMLLSPELVDYVLVHELCHLRHMNHSPDFWSLVQSVFPDFQARRLRLRAAPLRLWSAHFAPKEPLAPPH